MPRVDHGLTRRPLVGLIAGLALLTAGCSSAVSGHGTAVTPSVARSAPEPSTPPSSPPLSSPPVSTPPVSTPPATTTAPVPPPVTRVAESRKLLPLLEPKPAGAVTWSEAWGSNTTPTIAQWVHREYEPADAAFAESSLMAQGLIAIAHRTWIAKDSNQADVTLLGFRTAAGAASRWLSASRAQGESTGVRKFRIRGAAGALAYYHPQLDDQGYVRTIVYAHRGSIVLELFAYTPSRLKAPDIIAWTKAQLQRLPG